MKDIDKRLGALKHISAALAHHALQPVAKANLEIQGIDSRVAELASHRTKLTVNTGDPSIAGTMLAQAERLRAKQVLAMAELASAHVALDKARAAAAKAVGRNRALEEMIKKKQAAARLQASRRLFR